MHSSIAQRLRQNPILNTIQRGLWFLGALLCLSDTPGASQLESFSVVEVDGVYETSIVALLDAPAHHVYGVITDYRHIYRINPSIVESEVMPGPDDKTVRVHNRLEHCFAVFCFDIDLVEDVVVIGDKHIVATTVSDLSSFESGSAMWHVRPFTGDKARVQYRAHVKPDFFILPLIGSAIMKSMLRREIINSLARIECHARINARNGVRQPPIRIAKQTQGGADCPG